MVQETESTKHKSRRQREVAAEIGKSGRHDLKYSFLGHAGKDNISKQIETTTTGTTGSLVVVERREEDRVSKEHNRFARHVETKGEGARGNDHSQESLAEKDLDTIKQSVSKFWSTAPGIRIERGELTLDGTHGSYQRDELRYHDEEPR